MKFFAIMAKMTPSNMEDLAQEAKRIFKDIPFYHRLDYSRRVTCHGYSWTMSDEERAKAGDLIGEEDRFIPEELVLTPNTLFVKGRYEIAEPSIAVMIDLLWRTDGDRDSQEILERVPFGFRPINVIFEPY